MQYRCVKRVTLDNVTIHEVGSVIELTDEQAQTLLRARAVEPVPMAALRPSVPAASPTTEQLQQEVDQLKHQIEATQHEGGTSGGEQA